MRNSKISVAVITNALNGDSNAARFTAAEVRSTLLGQDQTYRPNDLDILATDCSVQARTLRDRRQASIEVAGKLMVRGSRELLAHFVEPITKAKRHHALHTDMGSFINPFFTNIGKLPNDEWPLVETLDALLSELLLTPAGWNLPLIFVRFYIRTLSARYFVAELLCLLAPDCLSWKNMM